MPLSIYTFIYCKSMAFITSKLTVLTVILNSYILPSYGGV